MKTLTTILALSFITSGLGMRRNIFDISRRTVKAEASLEDFESLFENDIFYSMSFSMSMSMHLTERPSTAPSDFPSAFPSSLPSDTPSSVPSVSPTIMDTGTSTSTDAPTVDSTPSETTTGNTSAPTLPDFLFQCSNSGLVETAGPPFDTFSVVKIKVGYLVESLSFFSDYREDLEAKLLSVAVAGALECNEGGAAFAEGIALPISTVLTGGACTSIISPCVELESEFEFYAAGDVDTDLAAFMSYLLLQEEMDSGLFALDVPLVDRVEYVSPLPLLPPLVLDPETFAPVSSSRGGGGISPWTLGAVVAMSISGLVSLAVWARNRRTRNERHMHLMEEMSEP